MDNSNRVDIVDFIINVLKEHEDSLDELVNRLEQVNKDFEVSAYESSYFFGKDKDAATDVLTYKVKELEEKLEKYQKTLRVITRHCDKINDTICLRKIADNVLKSWFHTLTRAEYIEILFHFLQMYVYTDIKLELLEKNGKNLFE